MAKEKHKWHAHDPIPLRVSYTRPLLSTHQLDHFDEHPVVARGGHDLEESGCQGEVVLWVLPSQLTYDANGCTLHPRVGVFDLLLQARVGGSQCVRKLEENAVEHKYGFLPQVWFGGHCLCADTSVFECASVCLYMCVGVVNVGGGSCWGGWDTEKK